MYCNRNQHDIETKYCSYQTLWVTHVSPLVKLVHLFAVPLLNPFVGLPLFLFIFILYGYICLFCDHTMFAIKRISIPAHRLKLAPKTRYRWTRRNDGTLLEGLLPFYRHTIHAQPKIKTVHSRTIFFLLFTELFCFCSCCCCCCCGCSFAA